MTAVHLIGPRYGGVLSLPGVGATKTVQDFVDKSVSVTERGSDVKKYHLLALLIFTWSRCVSRMLVPFSGVFFFLRSENLNV